MILHLEDWGQYPDAIVHWRTTNKSFVDLAQKFKDMGIRNYAFCLALLNPDLEFVDPHDPNLDPELAALVAIECMFNPWYFIREVIRIPPRGSREPLKFKASRGNICLFWCFFNHVMIALLQPRQTGKSVGVDSLNLCLLTASCVNTNINLMTLNNKLRMENVSRLKLMRSYLPFYMQHRHKGDSDNFHEVVVTARRNELSTAVGQKSEAEAATVSRGLTAAITETDEGPYIPYIETVLGAMLPAGDAARDEAKRYGTPYGVIFTTTAGEKDTPSGRFMYDFFHSAMPWTEILYDAGNQQELEKIVRTNNKDGRYMVHCVFSHRQLGYSDEWLREKLRENNISGDKARRDYMNEWTAGSLRSPFTPDMNEAFRQSKKDPVWTEIHKYGYAIRWYLTKEELEERFLTEKIIVGIDPSEALGGARDNLSLVFVDNRTLEVLGAASINETNVIRFSSWLCHMMVEKENLIAVIERRSMGMAIIDALLLHLPMAGIDPFRRMYNTIVDDANVNKDAYNEILQHMNRRDEPWYNKRKGCFGFVTSGGGRHSRSALYTDTLQRAASLGCTVTNDKMLIDEITGLIEKNNRIDHQEGGHDDMVVGWLLTAWFLSSSKNLQFYGITAALSKTKEFKIGATRVVEAEDPYQQRVNYRQEVIKSEINDLLEELNAAKDDNVIAHLERRIKVLDSRLMENFSEVNTVDALIQEAKNKRNAHTNNRWQRHVTNNGTMKSAYRFANRHKASSGRYYEDVVLY